MSARQHGFWRHAWSRALVVGIWLTMCAPGCSGLTGTISLDIVTAPDSTIMDQVTTIRLTLSEPFTVIEAQRSASGSFDLSLDVEAGGQTATIEFEGLDADGALVAYGRTLPLPLAVVDADIALSVAPPWSLSEAPVRLEPARSHMGVATLAYGAAIAGGREADGTLSGQLHIYNGYLHDFQVREDLPEKRANLTNVAGSLGDLYLFGGVDSDGLDTATGWRFANDVTSDGNYSPMAANGDLARSDARAAALPNETFVLTGDPAGFIDGVNMSVSEYSGAPALGGTATTVVIDGTFYAVFTGGGNQGAEGFVLSGGEFLAINEPALARVGHETVILPDATTLTVAGALTQGGAFETSGVVVDVRSQEAMRHEAVLAIGRRDAAIAATREYVLVAGGVDDNGDTVGDAEILDANTLAPVTVLPMLVPRRQATAVALSNGQILILGGLDATGAPTSIMELFTPGPS